MFDLGEYFPFFQISFHKLEHDLQNYHPQSKNFSESQTDINIDEILCQRIIKSMEDD